MARPGGVSWFEAARLVGSPVWFVRHLVSRGMLPAPKDGVFDVAQVRASVAYQVGGLSTPLSERELFALDARLRMPNRGVMVVAGRRYCPLWRVLAGMWGVRVPDA